MQLLKICKHAHVMHPCRAFDSLRASSMSTALLWI